MRVATRRPAAFGHRVARVGREVHQDLLDLPRVGAHERQRGVGLDVQTDVGADQTREQAAQPADHLVEIERARLHHLLAAEGEELARQRRRAFGGPADLLDVGPAGVAALELVEQQVGVAEDRRQHVVEVVGDAAGQPADRFHLLGLPERFLAGLERALHVLPVGDVAMVDDDRLHGRVGQAVDADGLAPAPAAVLVLVAVLDLQHLLRVL